MQYLNNNWQRILSTKISLILATSFFFIFFFYIYIIFSWALAQRYFEDASNFLENARSLEKEVVVEKSILYQKALRLMKKAARLNPYDARYYFEYAEVITELGGDSELSSSLDINSMGVEEKGDIGFYNLAKSYYLEAIKREPTNAIYHQRLGDIYDKLSINQKAEEELNKSILLDPYNIVVHLYLSKYFLSRNRQTDFLYYLNKAVDFYRRSGIAGGYVSEQVENFLKTIDREYLIKR
jgi:tetratricopeptide (TPR) repeat protein